NSTRTLWVSLFARTARAPAIEPSSSRTSTPSVEHTCGQRTRTRPRATCTTRSSDETLTPSYATCVGTGSALAGTLAANALGVCPDVLRELDSARNDRAGNPLCVVFEPANEKLSALQR